MTFRLCVALGLLALLGCGGSDGSEPQAAAEQFGYIRSVDPAAEPPTLDFDEAEWLTGEAAQQAAEADGAISRGDPVPNDYYVRNPTTARVGWRSPPT